MKVTEKIAVLRNLMQQDGIDYYYIPTNDFHGSEYVADYFKCREYMSGFTGSAGSLLVSATEAGLWTDGRYFLQAEAQLADVDFTAYAEVLFVSKSVGTIIASAYAQKLEETGTEAELRHILYTPLAATYNFAPKHAAAFIGTADPWSDVPAVIRMSEAQDVPMHVYENANHSLETADTLHNLKILQDVMEKTKAII